VWHFSGKIFGNKEMRLLMLGLDAAGKTSELPLLMVVIAGWCSMRCHNSDSLQTQVEPICNDYSNGFAASLISLIPARIEMFHVLFFQLDSTWRQ
jgi:hypothetical protein